LKQPELIVLFLDRSLGKQIIATALRNAALQVEVHDDHFRADAADAEWLTEIGRRGWIVLTKDKRIRYRTLELQAVVSAQARIFTLSAGSMQGIEMADVFVKALPKIRNYVQTNPPPYIVQISRRGKLTRIYP